MHQKRYREESPRLEFPFLFQGRSSVTLILNRMGYLRLRGLIPMTDFLLRTSFFGVTVGSHKDVVIESPRRNKN